MDPTEALFAKAFPLLHAHDHAFSQGKLKEMLAELVAQDPSLGVLRGWETMAAEAGVPLNEAPRGGIAPVKTSR